MIDALVKLAPVLTALSPVAVIWVTRRLGKRKSQRDDLLDDYTRVRKERDEYEAKLKQKDNEIEELKAKLDEVK